MKSRLHLVLLCAAFACAFTLLGNNGCEAEVIQLKTGESVTGRIVHEESNEEILVFQDLARGSMRRFNWKVFDAVERKRIRTLLGWEDNVDKTIQGDVLTQKLDDGSREELRGKIVKEEAGFIHFKTTAQTLKIPAGQIVERRKETMDKRDVYSSQELWDLYVADLSKNKKIADIFAADARTKFAAAQYAEWAEQLEEAKTLYESAAAEEGYLNAKVATQRAAAVAELIRDAEARASLKQMKQFLAYKNFRRFKAADTEFGTKHPEVGEAVTILLTRLREDFERKRNEYFRTQARYLFPRLAEKLIEKKVKEDDITVTDVTSWTRSDLPKEAFAQLAEKMQKKDDITPEEAQAFWDQRKKRNWITRSYGSGTFIVKPASTKAPKRRTSSNNNRRSQAGPKLKTPKPPTRDQWWTRAKSRERTNFAMAYFAEKSGLFELGDEKLFPCKLCNGSGYESRQLQSGGLHRWICTRCAGTKNDFGVKFR